MPRTHETPAGSNLQKNLQSSHQSGNESSVDDGQTGDSQTKVRSRSSGTRAQQKRRTRRAIIEAALRLSAERGFSSVSLRSVAREAGIAPTSFYRHFHDIDDLGLALVDEVGLSLRQLVRRARLRTQRDGSVVRTSIETFMEFVESNTNLFRLLLGEGAGSTPDFRRALNKEIQRFTQDLIEDLIREGRRRRRPIVQAPLVAEAMVTVALNLGAGSVDLPAEERHEIQERIIKEVRIIMLGAEAMAAGWKPVDEPSAEKDR